MSEGNVEKAYEYEIKKNMLNKKKEYLLLHLFVKIHVKLLSVT